MMKFFFQYDVNFFPKKGIYIVEGDPEGVICGIGTGCNIIKNVKIENANIRISIGKEKKVGIFLRQESNFDFSIRLI